MTMSVSPARILIVEDEALVAMEMRFTLEDLGHEVAAVAADARAARDFAAENDIDLALVDIHLQDGPTGVELGRDLAESFDVTVLYETANPGMLRDGVAGTVGVLAKPTDEACVEKAVNYALRRRVGEPAEAPRELRLLG